MSKKFEMISSIATLSMSFISLIISIIALFISHQGQDISNKQFEIDTKENLLISIGTENIESINLKLEENDKDYATYCLKVSICFVNTSNLPIYIDNCSIKRNLPLGDGKYQLTSNLEIKGIDLPLLIEPQRTEYIKCYIQIPIPDNVNQYIIEKFENIDDLDITKIGEYLFFEKQVDLIGNKVIVDNKNNELCYKYNPTIPFTVFFWTTRGNYFSTDYYTGLYLPGLKYLNEQYKGINFQIKYGEEKFEDIVFDFISEYTTFVVLVDIIVIFAVYKLKNKFIKVKSPKNNNNN